MKNLRNDKIGKTNYNNQGFLMKVIEYNNYNNIIVEFQDEFKAQVHSRWDRFKNGNVKNPYAKPYNIGLKDAKYPICLNNKKTKEFLAWSNMMKRCFDENFKDKNHTYKNATCCKEWISYNNFYEWLHQQENFDKWLNGQRWALDKDIIVKGNKIYSPETCCLVPQEINNLFCKSDIIRGNLPIGVSFDKRYNTYQVDCYNRNKRVHIGSYQNKEDAFYAYKKYKEKLIKQIAKEEYNKDNITRICYEAMMRYEVEITD